MTALVLCSLELLDLFVTQRLEERRRIFVLTIFLVIGDEFEDRLPLAVADAGIRLVHHPFHIALPLRVGHGGVDGTRNGVAFCTLVREHLVALLLWRGIAGDIDLVRSLVLWKVYIAGLRQKKQGSQQPRESYDEKRFVH